VATKGNVVPRANAGFAGVTASEIKAGWPTINVAEAVIDPELAVIVDEPTPSPVASPPLTIVATDVEDEFQLTALVRSCVLPSL
jgi:hypothetical protein